MLATKIVSVSIMLSSAFSISNNVVPGKIQYSYDPFKNKTTITVTGEQINQDQIMYLSDEFDGKQSNSSDFVALGFLTYQICPHPNFIADGKRVQPSPNGESMAGIDMFQAPVNTARGVEDYLFVYNFYAIPQIRQIANARSVKYKICNDVYSLSTADRAELRQFLSRFK